MPAETAGCAALGIWMDVCVCVCVCGCEQEDRDRLDGNRQPRVCGLDGMFEAAGRLGRTAFVPARLFAFWCVKWGIKKRERERWRMVTYSSSPCQISLPGWIEVCYLARRRCCRNGSIRQAKYVCTALRVW
ncbi:hypothetical protein LZ31DRAFT_558012 [Colletotrichum somersetense]|nr:hypothetical protein LZ31DRAFT_558012 [Colletotrichum somersetense]